MRNFFIGVGLSIFALFVGIIVPVDFFISIFLPILGATVTFLLLLLLGTFLLALSARFVDSLNIVIIAALIIAGNATIYSAIFSMVVGHIAMGGRTGIASFLITPSLFMPPILPLLTGVLCGYLSSVRDKKLTVGMEDTQPSPASQDMK